MTHHEKAKHIVRNPWFAMAIIVLLLPSAINQLTQARQASKTKERQVASCERGNKLRGVVDDLSSTGQTLRDVVLQNVGIAAETDPSAEARKRWRAQERVLAPLVFDSVPQIDCEDAVERGP